MVMSNCESFYDVNEDYFAKADCLNTAREIAQQPEIWLELGCFFAEKQNEIQKFRERLMNAADTSNPLRIVFTGAGSSAFIGDALAPLLAKTTGVKAESIHTTDIVTSPESFLFDDIPTLLISFARSGNSPESTGAVNYARSIINDLYEVAIICDGESSLARLTAESDRSLTLVMPEGSNDKGFAMTSSVTCMLLAGFSFFSADRTEDIISDIKLLSQNVSNESRYFACLAREWAAKEFDRIVYLGSGFLKAVAHEASLKFLELTNGIVNSSYESATGFRHGPKSVIEDRTVTVHMLSNDPFTRPYDMDLLKEVYYEKKQNYVVAIGKKIEGNIPADEMISIPSEGFKVAGDLCTGIESLVFCQMFSMFKSTMLGIGTDNPSPGGEVNRVVKGVTIYDYRG